MSFSVPELEDAEVIFDIGYNAPVSHPLVARHIVRAKKKGCKIICVDPRLTETGRIATIYLPIKGGTNMLFLNAMAHVIVTEDLVDHDFIEKHTTGFADYAKEVAQEKYAPEAVAAATHLDPGDIRRAARLFASSKHTMTLWGMGITQFSQGVECVIACSNLSLMTGNYGHYATGVGPVRGQNNVQGTCDMGVLPNQYPGYQDVTDDAIRHQFERAWGVKSCANRTRKNGSMPITSSAKTRPSPTRTCRKSAAPCRPSTWSSSRISSSTRPANMLTSFSRPRPGANTTAYTRPATAASSVSASSSNLSRAARRTGKSSASWQRPWAIPCTMTEQIWDETRSLCPKFAGASYEKMVENHGVQWPCTEDSPDDTGTQYLHKDAQFATADGKGHFYYYPWTPAKELESPEYPLSLSTVREVGHYSVRTMTGNCRLLADLADEPGYIQMNPEDCQELGIANGDLVRVVSKRGHTITRCQETDRVSKGATYMTYQWWIGACNELTSAALDPKSHTPEFKYCACRVEKIDDQKQAERDVKAQYAAIRARMGIEVKEV